MTKRRYATAVQGEVIRMATESKSLSYLEIGGGAWEKEIGICQESLL